MRPTVFPSVLSFRLLVPLAALGVCAASASAQSVAGFTVPAGYSAVSLGLSGSAFAVGPDGKFAVAQDNFAGGATVTVYGSIAANRKALATFSAPAGDTFNYFGGIAWKDANNFAFSENGSSSDVFSASLTTGTVTPLAPLGSLPFVAQIAYNPGDATGTLYAGLSGGPNANSVYTVANGAATAFATGLGTGYLGGLAFRPTDGALFVGDTNDPTFAQNAGQVLQIGANGKVANTISLAGGNGADIAGLTFDRSGSLFATTGGTLSELPSGAAQSVNFGMFAGGNSGFPGDIQFFGGDFAPFGGGTGILLVNGGFGTGVSGLFAIRPLATPEVGGCWGLGVGGWVLGAGLLRRRKGGRA